MSEVLNLKDELELINKRYNNYWSVPTHSTPEILNYINDQLRSINNVSKIIIGTTIVGKYNIAYSNNGDIIENAPDNNIFTNNNFESISEMSLSCDSLTILNKELDAWGIPENYMCREIICQLADLVECGEIEPVECLSLTLEQFKTIISKLASAMSVSYNSVTAAINAMIKKADFSKSITFKEFNTPSISKSIILSRFIEFIASNIYD